MSIAAVLEKAVKSALSNEDILRITENKCKVIKYESLNDVLTLDELFAPHQACIILYETERNYGHWVAMIKEPAGKNGVVEFFDAYGLKPDSELKMIPSYFRKVSGQNKPLLTWLIESSPYICEYNEIDFQSMRKNVNTCGRWAAVRVRWREISLDKFQDLFGRGTRGSACPVAPRSDLGKDEKKSKNNESERGALPRDEEFIYEEKKVTLTPDLLISALTLDR